MREISLPLREGLRKQFDTQAFFLRPYTAQVMTTHKI